MIQDQLLQAFRDSNSPPLVIAELSGNHNQSFDRAIKMVSAAAEAGADAIKLQTYTPDTMTLDIQRDEFLISNNDNIWKGNSLYSLYKKSYTPWEWHQEIFEFAKSKGLIAFSSPFDSTSVEFLESLNTPCYKIASFENIHLPLIKRVAATGKPLIISTGMASIEELNLSVKTARDNGCKDLMLLKCTSSYPAKPEESNIKTIPDLQEKYQCPVGLSDHTLGITTAIASVALGARAIEKHFTLETNDQGIDSAFSLDTKQLSILVKEINIAWRALGEIHYGPTESERHAIKKRRSVYVVKDMKKGDIFTEDNIRCIRPGLGLAPKHYESILGKIATQNLKKGTPLQWEYVRR